MGEITGDLVFYTKEEVIDNVGVLMKDNYIIHAFGKAQIDRLDHNGIFNNATRSYPLP